MYLLYSVLLALGLVVGSPYWLFEMIRHGKYRKGMRERFGAVPERVRGSNEKSIWIHAVSVGEVLAVSELARALSSDFAELRVVISTTTDTGQKLAESRFGAENVFYFPLDFAFAVRRWLTALKPELVVVAETEFWPNFLREASRCGARVAIVNARISDRSLGGYLRWRGVIRQVLKSVDVFLAQTPEDARRLVEIGAPGDRVRVGGNLKFDVPPPRSTAIVDQLRASLEQSGAGPVLVCGSTVEGEEELLFRAFESVLKKYSAAVLLLAPRHPERFDSVAELAGQRGLQLQRRSQWHGDSLAGSVLLLDSIGELASVYALADVAFVGGSLVPRGGHNIIEPAQYGVPILVGPHTENFRDIVSFFQRQDAVRVVAAGDLGSTVMDLLSNAAERLALGKRAAAAIESQRGATQRTLKELRTLMSYRASETSSA